ncbi:MAG: hypothetical protein ACTSXG_01610 [Alphaproteobacteria bacterium]
MTKKEQTTEKLIMGLRSKEGVKFDNAIEQVIHKNSMEKLIKDGLLVYDGHRLKTTTNGRIFLESIIEYIF